MAAGRKNQKRWENKMKDKEQYEKDLKRKQEEHLRQVAGKDDYNSWQPCLHDSCTQCKGTGIKLDGSICIHNLSCPCPKCSFRY